MNGSYLGPIFSQQSIENELSNCGAHFESYDQRTMIEITAKALSEENAVGWFSSFLFPF